MAADLPRIFISYARADSLDFVDRLERDLKAQQFHPWVDRHGLEGGQQWLRTIQQAIDECQALVVVLSPEAVQSEYVHMEYHYAREEGKPVIPVMWRSVKTPMDLRLTQCLYFQTSYEDGLRQLAQALNRLKPAAPKPDIGTTLLTYKGHSKPIHAVAWSPDGTRITSGSWDGTAQVWDAATGKHLITYNGHKKRVNAVAWSPDGRLIASAGDDNSVQVWNSVTGRAAFIYEGHKDVVNAVVWSSDGKRIASAGGSIGYNPANDHTVQVWEVPNGKPLVTYSGHFDKICTVAWSPDGARLASGSWDSTVQVWHASTGKHIVTYTRSMIAAFSLAWSLDGSQLASGDGNGDVHLWDATTGNNLAYLEGENGAPISSVAWSPDGMRLASASEYGTVSIWNTAEEKVIYMYSGHASTVSSAA